MRNSIYIFFLLFIGTNGISQQLPQTNQYMFNLLPVNAAYAGSQSSLIAAGSYRHQWVGFDGAPRHQIFTVHSPLNQGKIGVGLQILNEKIGAHHVTGVSAVYAYHLPLAKGKLSMALRGSAYHYRFHWNKITYYDPGDPIGAFSDPDKLIPSFDFGTLYHTKRSFVGFEASQFNQGKMVKNGVSDASLITHYTLVGGHTFFLNESLDLKPSCLIRKVQAIPVQAEINISFLYNDLFWFGGSYRFNYGYSITSQLVLLEKFHLGYSYELATGGLQTLQSGSHEIFLSYEIPLYGGSLTSPRYF